MGSFSTFRSFIKTVRNIFVKGDLQEIRAKEKYGYGGEISKFKTQIENQLFSRLGHIKGLDINANSDEGCDFLLTWKDFYGRVRVVILECKQSESWNEESGISEGANKLLKYKDFIKEKMDWNVELLVVLTDLPSCHEAFSYLKKEVLVLDANSMFEDFVNEFIAWHEYTTTSQEQSKQCFLKNYFIPVHLRKTLINQCLNIANSSENKGYKDLISPKSETQEEEIKKQTIAFGLSLKEFLEGELGDLQGLKVNLQYKEQLSFSIEWKDILNRKRVIFIDCKYLVSDNPNKVELVEAGINKLHSKECAEDLQVDLLVFLTNFPWDNVEPAELRREVLILNMYSMLEVFLTEFKKWHKYTLVNALEELHSLGKPEDLNSDLVFASLKERVIAKCFPEFRFKSNKLRESLSELEI